MTKTLINTFYIGVLIVTPLFINSLQQSDDVNRGTIYTPWFWVGAFAALLSPLVLALIQNTAHKIAISLLNVAALGSVVPISIFAIGDLRDAHNPWLEQIVLGEYVWWWLLVSPALFIFALWLWQCFDGRRQKTA